MNIIELGNIAFRTGGPMAKGDIVQGHLHNYDHVTMVSHGSMLIEVMSGPAMDGVTQSVIKSTVKSAKEARNFVLILAGVAHRFTALEDGTVYQCVYAHRDEEGNAVDFYTGWEAAYS